MKNNMMKQFCRIFVTVLAVLMLMPCVYAQENSASLGIIGGADGPTAILVTDANGNSTTTVIDKNDGGTGLPDSGKNADETVMAVEDKEADTKNKQEKDQDADTSDDPFLVRLWAGGLLNMIPMGGGLSIAFAIAMYILAALIAYCLGSLNFGIIISKVVYKDDIRKYGSGNAGTTNMLRTYGKGAALGTILGDALKVVFAVIFGNILVGQIMYGGYVAGFFAVLGHVYPVYYKFKGGTGVVASAITILMLDWRVFLVVLGIFIIVVAIWRYISLGSILSAAAYPIIVYASAISRGRPAGLDFVFAVGLGLFVIILHRTNIQRLLDGKENKLSFKKTDKKAADSGKK